MRYLYLLALLAAVTLCVTGCTRGIAVSTDPPETRHKGMPSHGHGSNWEGVYPESPSLQRGKAKLRALETGMIEHQPVSKPTGDTSGLPEEVEQRMSDALREWDEYRRELNARESPQEESAKSSLETAPEGSQAEQVDVSRVLAIRRKYAATYLNARMRISLLESRLETAKGSQRDALSEKLAKAQADLQAIDDACELEIDLPPDATPEAPGESQTQGVGSNQQTEQTP